jgi:RNA polymerase sigma-70 factor (ECF subfamily)
VALRFFARPENPGARAPPLVERDFGGGSVYFRPRGLSLTEPDELTEQRFIERLVARDERAFNELVQAYEERVFRLLLRMLGRRDEAEDMAQEVFVQVFKAIGTFRGDSRLGTWIYRIAVNLCKNRMKYLSRRHASEQDELEPAAERMPLTEGKGVTLGEMSRPDHLVEGFQLERVVQACIAELEPDFREVLVLRDVEDLTYEELCEVTGLPEGTVKSRLHRARGMLKTAVMQRVGEKIE